MVNCDASDKVSFTSKPSDKNKPTNAAMRWPDATHPNNTATKSKRLKSSSMNVLRARSKTPENENNVEEYMGDNPDSSSDSKLEKAKRKSETCLDKGLKGGEEDEIGEANQRSTQPAEAEEQQSPESREGREKIPDGKSPSVGEVSGASGETCGNDGAGKPKPRRRSEIPKLKSIIKTNSIRARAGAAGSRLPIKTVAKEPEPKPPEPSEPPAEPEPKPVKPKKDKMDEKVKIAMKQEFSELVPMYEKQLKKITDVWVNTIYCSLTLRANLVKLMFHAFPHINKSQFHMEDERLLFRIAHAKNYTKSEADNLVQFVKALIANREKTKEDYLYMKANEEVAEVHDYDWRGLTKKITDLGDEIQQLKTETPEIQKKKEAIETNAVEKLQKLECYVHKKGKEIKKFESQLAVLKQREQSYKGGVFLKLEDYKDIKGDVLSLKSVEKNYQELKDKYKYQSEAFEKQIKDLECLLEEKQETLEREKAGKEKLQRLLTQMQENKRELAQTIGKEQADYFLGGSVRTKIKKRELLWVAAVKLVLKGFIMQVNKLERDKNKMLLELQSNNVENFTTLATAIIHKENFIESIKQQMVTYQKACKLDVSYADDH